MRNTKVFGSEFQAIAGQLVVSVDGEQFSRWATLPQGIVDGQRDVAYAEAGQ